MYMKPMRHIKSILLKYLVGNNLILIIGCVLNLIKRRIIRYIIFTIL
jgi:hypothetical protein